MAVKSLPFFEGRRAKSPIGWLSESLVATASERRSRIRAAASKPLLRSIGGQTVRVELLDWEAAAECKPAWHDLIARQLEPNVFLEPAFALYAAQHFAASRRPVFLFVTDSARGGDPDGLLGVWALEAPGHRFGAVAKGWRHNLAALGTPLLDRDRAEEALAALLDWFLRQAPQVGGVMLPALAGEGPTAAMIRAYATSKGLALESFDCGKRAVLPAGDATARLDATLTAKYTKQLQRQRRRLADRGRVTYSSATSPEAVRDSVERFLALEAKGWKGNRGTALLSDASLATFTRTMTRELGRQGKCRIDSLEIDGEPVAMGIILASGSNSYFWKIAYDETLARMSPGVQFTLDFTRRQLGQPQIAHTDSCAIPDHPMIDRLWSGRMPIVDLLIATAPHRANSLQAMARLEHRRRELRAVLKRLYHYGRRRLTA